MINPDMNSPNLAPFAPLREILFFRNSDLFPAKPPSSWNSKVGLTLGRGFLYFVDMKNVTASEARKNWFRLLDEALRGEVIVVQRKGRRLVLRQEEMDKKRNGASTRQYKKLLRVPDVDAADRWTWEWKGAAGGLVSRRRAAR